MIHEGACYCPNCDRSFDRDALVAALADVAALRAQLATALAEVERLKGPTT